MSSTNDKSPDTTMSNYTTKIREALEEAHAIDKRDNDEPSMYTGQLEDALAALAELEAMKLQPSPDGLMNEEHWQRVRAAQGSPTPDFEAKAQRFFMAWPNGDIPAMMAAFARSLTPSPIRDPTPLYAVAPAKPPATQQDQGDEGVPANTPSGFPLQSFADDGKRISAAIPNAASPTYPRISEAGDLLLVSENEDDTLYIGEVWRDLGIAAETMSKCERDLFGEFDYISGPEATDVDQWYPVDNIKSVIEYARMMFDAMMAQAGAGAREGGGEKPGAVIREDLQPQTDGGNPPARPNEPAKASE